MTRLSAHGIAAALPGGFEGQIFVRPRVAQEQTYPVAHFATFPIPAGVADFGGGAVNLMRATDIFAVLFEYGPESLGTRLFARTGMPRSLSPGDFRPYLLRRGLGGQSGTQWFFTEGGRPFTLYAVLGSHALRDSLVPRLNELLVGVAVSDAPAPNIPSSTPAVGSPTPWN